MRPHISAQATQPHAAFTLVHTCAHATAAAYSALYRVIHASAYLFIAETAEDATVAVFIKPRIFDRRAGSTPSTL